MRILPVVLAALAACASPAPARPVCFLFVMTDCPIANQFAPEIQRIVADYPRVEFRVVYEDAGDVERHAREYGLPGAMRDERHELARRMGATITPEAVVTRGGAVVYRGRIDDRYYDLGKWKFQPTTHDLRDALDDVLAGRPVRVAETKAIGCSISE